LSTSQALQEVASRISNSDEATIKGVVPFADGGIVTKPTLGLIGEAGYNEAVVPFKDPNDPLNMKAVSNKVDKTNEKLDILERILTTLVTNNINTYKLLQRIEQNGLIALEETA